MAEPIVVPNPQRGHKWDLIDITLCNNNLLESFYSLDIPSSVAQLAAMATTQEYPMTASSSNGGVAAGAVLFSSKD